MTTDDFDIDEIFPWELAQKWAIRMQQLERAGFFEGDEYDLIIKHGQHNQKTHGSRYGAGQAKESLRRLKDDKQARERYKTNARKRGQGSGGGSKDITGKIMASSQGRFGDLKTMRETFPEGSKISVKNSGAYDGDFVSTGQYKKRGGFIPKFKRTTGKNKGETLDLSDIQFLVDWSKSLGNKTKVTQEL